MNNEENHMVMGQRFEESYERPEPEYEAEGIVYTPEFYYVPTGLLDELFFRLDRVNEKMEELDDFLYDSIIREKNPIGEPE